MFSNLYGFDNMKYKQCEFEGTEKCIQIECPTKRFCDLTTHFGKLRIVGTYKGLKK